MIQLEGVGSLIGGSHHTCTPGWSFTLTARATAHVWDNPEGWEMFHQVWKNNPIKTKITVYLNVFSIKMFY